MTDKLIVKAPTTEEEWAEYERVGIIYWKVRMAWRWN